MDTRGLDLVEGEGPGPQGRNWHGAVEEAVNRAIRAGFSIGRRVRIGRVAGRVVGYNIGAFGRYSGASYPLLVKTDFGVAKCSLQEVAAA
jgi:hypothetical protein